LGNESAAIDSQGCHAAQKEIKLTLSIMIVKMRKQQSWDTE